jgi:hypothetical protein
MSHALASRRARWSNSSDASRSPSAIVRSDFSDFGVSGAAPVDRREQTSRARFLGVREVSG